MRACGSLDKCSIGGWNALNGVKRRELLFQLMMEITLKLVLLELLVLGILGLLGMRLIKLVLMGMLGIILLLLVSFGNCWS